MKEERLFTSESVTVGHPDKVADIISDAVLDEVLRHDPNGRVACETFAPGHSLIVIGGEITSSKTIDIEGVARRVIREIGYTDKEHGLDPSSLIIQNVIKPQSPDIAQGVDHDKGLHNEQGAGDQGLMFGFAINEGPEFMPLPLSYAHKLAERLQKVREVGTLPYLRPDGKTQVTMHYDSKGKPDYVHTVVVSTQHNPDVTHEKLVKDIKEHVILPVVGERVVDKTVFHINPTGAFVQGGPAADAGLTGRKIIVDTYGGGSLLYRAGHGGGAFSGKDPSKVDRSAAYVARYIAKNIVAAGLAYVCEVQLAYAIGVAAPVSVLIRTFGTGKVPDEKLENVVRDVFPLKPASIIAHFDLKRPIYQSTAAYGHFGNPSYPWEQLDKVEELKKRLSGSKNL